MRERGGTEGGERKGKREGEREEGRGLSVFLSLKEKSWMVVVVVYPLHLSHDKLWCRQGQGFTAAHKVARG